jgi:hypothetical protein
LSEEVLFSSFCRAPYDWHKPLQSSQVPIQEEHMFGPMQNSEDCLRAASAVLTVAVVVQRLRDKDLALRKVRHRKAGDAAAGGELVGGERLGPDSSLVESQKVVINQLAARITALLKVRPVTSTGGALVVLQCSY